MKQAVGGRFLCYPIRRQDFETLSTFLVCFQGNPLTKVQWYDAMQFTKLSALTNYWTNSQTAGDLF